MEKIYSSVSPNRLLHIIVRKQDFIDGRQDVIPVDHYLQCAMLKMDKGKTFKPHYHIWKKGPEYVIAQESWVVIQGRVKCLFYDVNNILIGDWVLEAGDASFTLEGGHTYEILEDGTLVFEYKSSKYEGQHMDKRFIE